MQTVGTNGNFPVSYADAIKTKLSHKTAGAQSTESTQQHNLLMQLMSISAKI